MRLQCPIQKSTYLLESTSMRNFPFADLVTNGYGEKNRMLWLTPFTWSFFDLSNNSADFLVFFLYLVSVGSNRFLPYIEQYIIDRNFFVFWKKYCMVYMIFSLFWLCIRNALAALVMKCGIMPFCDLRASSYAYKNEDLINWSNLSMWRLVHSVQFQM